ncbi:YfiR family protein [Oligoflexia bacterium]|nr:YfiR family protein [Oligoflexia bacterium]
MHVGRSVPLWALALVLLFLSLLPASAGAQESSLYIIHASFVRNFLKFTTFPEEIENYQNWTICIANDRMVKKIFLPLETKQVRDKGIFVTSIAPLAEASSCQVLFFPSSKEELVSPTLKTLGVAPVLTVSDSSGFSLKGGMIELYEKADRVKFKINLKAAQRANIKFSSRLLHLAEIEDGVIN